jgi:hypothetical protein
LFKAVTLRLVKVQVLSVPVAPLLLSTKKPTHTGVVMMMVCGWPIWVQAFGPLVVLLCVAR